MLAAEDESPGNETTDGSSPPAARLSFGDYELLEEIGRGGMGVVYRARQRSLDRVVAIKMITFGPGSSPDFIKRFRAEAVSAASLHHPNIVAIHEVGIHEGRHFFVMDHVEGQSLARLVGNQSLPARRAAAFLKTIAEAVHYAHERGILHRDLKPSNVLIDAQDQPHLVDFGLARRLEGSSELTVTGQVLGSPHYLPPEQAAGQRARVSRRTDVYALGATLYHLLTGRPPFQAESLAQTLELVLHADPVAPRLLNPSVPRDLETICLKCLEKEPARRYPTARVLADELGRFQSAEPIRARPLGPLARVWRWCRRKPEVAALAGVAALLFLLGFTGVLGTWRRAELQRQRAEAGELSVQRRAYISEINSAQQALKASNPERALELLNRHRPAHSSLGTDLRGFEWSYLWQQCQSGAAAVVGVLPSRIRSLEVSPDGRWLAAGSERGAVKVWNLATGEEVSVLPDQGWKSFVNFSPDSRLLLFTDQSTNSWGTLRVLDMLTRERRTFITNSWALGAAAFSPSGRWLGYGAADPKSFRRKVVVVDFATLTNSCEMNTLTPITDDFHGFEWVFTSDSRSILFSENDPDRTLALEDFIAGKEPQQHVPGHRDAITAIAISPDGRILATGAGLTSTGVRSEDNGIKLWEVPSLRPLGELSGHKDWIVGLKFSPDGQTLASGSADQTIRLWDVPTQSLKWVSRRLPQAVWRVCFAPDGRTLFSGCQDGAIHRWSLHARQEERGFSHRPAALDFLAVAPSGERFAGIRLGAVYLNEADSLAFSNTVPELGTNNGSLLFSRDGQCLFAGTWSGEVQVWSLSRRQLVHRLQQPFPEPVTRLMQDARGQSLAEVYKLASNAANRRLCNI
jgi:WD40 repeat protein/predicted Ser/Thr protein kinase